jgi:hypothetical protein
VGPIGQICQYRTPAPARKSTKARAPLLPIRSHRAAMTRGQHPALRVVSQVEGGMHGQGGVRSDPVRDGEPMTQKRAEGKGGEKAATRIGLVAAGRINFGGPA